MPRPFVRLIIFYISFLWASSFLRAIIPPHVLSEGVTFQQMAIGYILVFAGQIALFFILNKNFSSKLSWYLAMISLLVAVILLIDIKSIYQFYLSFLLSGFNLYLFFIFYNIAHFETTPREKTGISSGLMFGIPSLIGVLAPLIAGFLGEINILFAWGISILSLVISTFLIRIQTNFTISYKILDSIREIASTRIFIFLEGVWEALIIGLIPIYTLFFIKTTLGYGAFLSYLSLLSVVATLLIGRLSDKLQKRIVFLYPVTLFMALTTFFFPFATENLTLWLILSGVISFLTPIFWNISTAMVVDMSPNLRVSIPGRELVLAVGRIVGLSLVLLSFIYEQKPFIIFPILGIVMLIYPLSLLWKSKVRKKHEYL